MLNSYLYLAQFDKFLQSLPRNDDLPLVVFYRGLGEYYSQNVDRAISNFDRAYELDPSQLQSQVGKAISYGSKHQPQAGLKILRAAEQRIQGRGVTDPEAIYKVGQAYAVLGDSVSALRVVRQSVEGGFFPYPYIASDPLTTRLHSNTQFANLLNAARQRHEAFKAKFF
jgi:tetratricopeptide (TPR) repeat protein